MLEITQYVPVTHHRPDHDELVALRILEMWGRHEFPGLALSPLQFVDAGLSLKRNETGDDWLANGFVVIGALGGRFCEHNKGDGKCAATLAADYYGISDEVGLAPILKYALQADDKSNDAPFNIARIIKDLHASGVVPVEEVRAMANVWFDSQLVMLREHPLSGTPLVSLQEMAVQLLLKRYGIKRITSGTFAGAMEAVDVSADDADILREIERYVDAPTSTNELASPFNLKGLVRCLQLAGIPMATVRKHVATILNAKSAVQRQFMEAQKYFRQKAAYVPDCPLKVAVVRSDNEQMNRAARATDHQLALLIQQRSSGRVQIFSDQRRDLRPVLARIRDREHSLGNAKRCLSGEQLCLPGTIWQVPQWYGFEKYGKVIHILNGTVKALATPKTRLPLDEIVACVREGLKYTERPRGVKRRSSRS